MGSKFVETFFKDTKAPFAKKVCKDLSLLLGGMGENKGDAHFVTDAMQMGHAAQSIILGRDDVTNTLKEIHIKYIQKFHQDTTMNSELCNGGIHPEEMKQIKIIQRPGMYILPSMQNIGSCPDALTKCDKFTVPCEVKFTLEYKGPITKYYSQCQMALLTTGGPFSILLLANATSATMTNVADVAAICEVVTHIILPDLIWQRDMKFAAQFLVSICKLVTPQLIMGPEIPCAPASLEEALSLPKNAISTIKIRKGRSLRLTGCQAEMQFKYFTNFTDG